MRRILRPEVFRVPPAHVPSRVGPGAGPEAGEVGGERDRATRRGEQREAERHASAGQPGRGREAVEGLCLGLGRRHGLGVVDPGPPAGQGEVGGQLVLEAGREQDRVLLNLLA